MNAEITTDRALVTFDRVDLVKQAVGERVLPGDDDLWILGQDFTVVVNGITVTVPRGFTTDGASIPWPAQLLTGWRPWDEPQRWGAIVHDWLYRCNGSQAVGSPRVKVSRRWADDAFRAVLVAAGAGWLKATAMHRAVAWFGGIAYRNGQAEMVTVRP